MFKVSAVVILLLFLKDHTTECRRYTGGGGRRLPSHNPSHTSHTHNSPPAYQHHPPSHGSGSGTVRPLGFDPPVAPPKYNAPVQHAPPQGTGGSGSGNRPIGFVDPSGHQSPSGHPAGPPHNQGTGTVRPLGFDTSGHSPGSSQTGHHVESPKQNSHLGNPPPYAPSGYHGQNPPPYNPHYNPGGYGQPPAYSPAGHAPPHNPAGYGQPPAYNPAGYGSYNPGNYHPQGGYQPQGGYHPQGGGGGVTIINNNINNHHGSYGGYGGYSPPVYTTHDTGSTALGFFLGYSLAKISTPSYIYHGNSYDGSSPRYDHYSVHHYYHNNQDVPKEATIQPNAIVACVGDTGSFCPANTTSLCTNNGAVMCVASALSTVPCLNEKQTNCVKSTVPCKDNNAPECKQSAQNTTSIAIPCISTAKIYGDISYVNNSIVISNHTSHNNTSSMSSNTTEVLTTTDSNSNYTTTTTSTLVNASTTNATDVKQGPAQMFCVTILALPAERKLTEGEKLFQYSKNVFSNFAVKVLGIK